MKIDTMKRKSLINRFVKGNWIGLLLLLLLLATSCVTHRKTTYLQEDKKTTEKTTVVPETYKIQVSDNLYIRVITPDPKWATIFNTLPVNANSITVTEQSADLISYPVLANGAIDMPFIGEIAVVGKTLPEIKQAIKTVLVDYITDYDLTVRLVNNYVSLLGDVANPGRYTIYKDQLNIFQALAMASDMADYADRHYVQIIRPTSNGPLIKNFDLTKRDILSSEFFYVMPNDIIYAQPMRGKFFKMNSFPFSILLTAMTTTILMLNYLDN
jgi:polysaccharide export outer membrane protein